MRWITFAAGPFKSRSTKFARCNCTDSHDPPECRNEQQSDANWCRTKTNHQNGTKWRLLAERWTEWRAQLCSFVGVSISWTASERQRLLANAWSEEPNSGHCKLGCPNPTSKRSKSNRTHHKIGLASWSAMAGDEMQHTIDTTGEHKRKTQKSNEKVIVWPQSFGSAVCVDVCFSMLYG